MSITKPALQTIPKKDKRIRRAFVPDAGYKLWFMDLDQIEYRLFAHYAKIPSLLEAIAKGHDVHAATAAMIAHIDADVFVNNLHEYEELSVKKKELNTTEFDERINELQTFVDMRSRGKTINFALVK